MSLAKNLPLPYRLTKETHHLYLDYTRDTSVRDNMYTSEAKHKSQLVPGRL